MPSFDNLKGIIPVGAADYILLYESLDGNATPTVQHRVYMKTGTARGGLVHTVNARWNGSQWVRDIADDSGMLAVPNSALSSKFMVMHSYPAGSASPWNDGAWTEVVNLGGDTATLGRLRLYGNLGTGVGPTANSLNAMNINKAWAHLTYDGTGDTVTKDDSFNIGTTTMVTGVSGYLDIAFYTSLANATYSAIAQDISGGGAIDRYAKCANLATGGLRIYILDPTGAIIDPTGIQGQVTLQVFGKQS